MITPWLAATTVTLSAAAASTPAAADAVISVGAYTPSTTAPDALIGVVAQPAAAAPGPATAWLLLAPLAAASLARARRSRA